MDEAPLQHHLGDQLAIVGRFQFCDLRPARQAEIGQLAQHLRALLRDPLRPAIGIEGPARGLHGKIDIARLAVCDGRPALAGGGVLRNEGAALSRVPPLAIDIELIVGQLP